jgi:glycerophosphoryl diester phosphodiesterase
MLALFSTPAVAEAPAIFFQSHRGGMNEVPENTLTALEHSWAIPGAIPEVDLRTTSDEVIVCIHDRTPERTTNAAHPWTEIFLDETPLERVREWDAGVRFGEAFAGQKVPTLEEVFAMMKNRPAREIYLDLKAVDLEKLVAFIDAHDMREQVLFVHGTPAMCERLSQLWPGARVMTWISDPPDIARKRFERMAENGFHGVAQLQFHLHAVQTEPEIAYGLDWEYLADCATRLREKGIALQIRPFEFDAKSLRRLIDLGAHGYVTDDPKAFRAALDEALAE